MLAVLSFVLALVFVVAVFLFVGGGLAAWVWPLFFARLSGISAAGRARALGWFAASPLLGALAVVGLGLMPSMASFAWPALDHCVTHDEHLHLCFAHWTVEGLPGWMLACLAAISAWSLWRMAGFGRWLRDTQQRLHLLARISSYDHGVGVLFLESARLVAFVGGFWRQRIFVSRTTWNALSPAVQAVLLDHEGAHIQRRDNLRKLAARILSVGHRPQTRASVLGALSLACEQACDEVAASRAGRLHVAKALLSIERQCQQSLSLDGVSQAGEHLEARVLALLAPAPTQAHRRWIGGAFAAAFGLALLASLPLHHIIEHLLGLLLEPW